MHTSINLDRGWSIRILAIALVFLCLLLPRDDGGRRSTGVVGICFANDPK